MNICEICNIHKSLNIGADGFSYWIIREAEVEKNCPGYHYIEAREHKISYGEFSIPEWEELGRAIHFVSQKIQKDFNPLKIYTVSISEKVPHLHFHIVPRHKETLKGMAYLDLALTGRLS